MPSTRTVTQLAAFLAAKVVTVVTVVTVATLSLAVLVGTSPAGAAAGNGEAAKPAATILSDAVAATSSADTARISGTIVQGSSRIVLDIVSDHGSGGGSLTQNGAKLDLVVTPPSIYLKGSAASWKKITGSAAAAKLFAGKWLQTTTSNSDFGSFGQLFDIATVADQLAKPQGTVVKGATTKYHGQTAIQLFSKSATSPGTLYVAATGTPYVLGIVGTGKKNRGELRFSQYDTAKLPAAPTGAIDLDQLEQSGSTTTTTPAG